MRRSASRQRREHGIHVNPLVTGSGRLRRTPIGTGVASARNRFTFAARRLPAGAATRRCCDGVLLWPQRAGAADRSRHAEERAGTQIEGEILCTCGCRNAVGSCGMLKVRATRARKRSWSRTSPTGGSRQNHAAFVAVLRSQAVLTRRLDRGFNRVAWAFPYLSASRAHRDCRERAPVVGTPDRLRRWRCGARPTINARLDDELRDLD